MKIDIKVKKTIYLILVVVFMFSIGLIDKFKEEIDNVIEIEFRFLHINSMFFIILFFIFAIYFLALSFSKQKVNKK